MKGSYSISISGSNCPDLDAARAAVDACLEKLRGVGGTVSATPGYYPTAVEETPSPPTAAEPAEIHQPKGSTDFGRKDGAERKDIESPGGEGPGAGGGGGGDPQ